MKESYRELQDRFTQKYNELYYPEGFTEENTPKSFWEIIDSLHAGVNYARNCMEFYLKENRSEDDFTLCEYYAKVLDTYLRTKAELNLGILFVSDCDVRKPWSERNPMIVENADDYIYTPTLDSENKDPLPSTKEQTTRKPDEDMVDAISYGLESLDLKYTKPFHPDEDILIRITKLIFEWCETVGIDLRTAKYHILAELYSMMRRFIMHKTSEEKKENKNQTSDEKENIKEKEDEEEMPILEKLYRATRNPTIFMSNERLFELFPIDDRIEFLQDEIRSYCCKLNKEDEEDKEDYYKYLLNIYKSIKQREKETDE